MWFIKRFNKKYLFREKYIFSNKLFTGQSPVKVGVIRRRNVCGIDLFEVSEM